MKNILRDFSAPLPQSNKIDYLKILGLSHVTIRLVADSLAHIDLRDIDLVNNNHQKVRVTFIDERVKRKNNLYELWANTTKVLIIQTALDPKTLKTCPIAPRIGQILRDLKTPDIKYLILQEKNTLTLYFFKDRNLFNKHRNLAKVSAILPAYNEEKTVRNVLEALNSSDFVDEIILINDGSSDNTLAQAQNVESKKLKIISMKNNRGKGYAVSCGIKAAQGNIICMIDADLENVKSDHINILVTPLILSESKIKGVLGTRVGGNINISKSLTGERSYYKKDLQAILPLIGKTKYGIETVINYYYRTENILMAELPDIKHYLKTEKSYTLDQLIESYTKEAIELAYYSAKLRLNNGSQQILKLTKLRGIYDPSKKILEDSITKFTDPQINFIFKDYLKRIESISHEYKKNYQTIKRRVSRK